MVSFVSQPLCGEGWGAGWLCAVVARSRRGGVRAPQVGSGSRCAGQRLGHASIDRGQVVRVDHLSPDRVIIRRYVDEAILAKRRIYPDLREAFLVAQRRLVTLFIGRRGADRFQQGEDDGRAAQARLDLASEPFERLFAAH